MKHEQRLKLNYYEESLERRDDLFPHTGRQLYSSYEGGVMENTVLTKELSSVVVCLLTWQF